MSDDPDYEVFREKLENATDSKGKPAPRYGVYDVEFELSGGEGKRYVPPCHLSHGNVSADAHPFPFL
jgi:hypothetical protein